MAQKPFTADTVEDSFAGFEAGMNSGDAPMRLPKNQLAFSTNGTVRGGYLTHRPPFSIQSLDFGGDANLKNNFVSGLFQGSCYYKPDSGSESLIASVSGRLFQLTPSGGVWIVKDISIPGDLNDASVTQAWLWQAEKWIIVTDGTTALPIFFDGTSSRRSIGNTIPYLTILTPFNVPANGANTIALTLSAAPAPQWPVGTPITGLFGEYEVQSLAGTTLVLKRTSSLIVNTGDPIAANAMIYPELPAGRMGAYGMGRVWMSLIDGKQFVAGDIVGGPSGTVANNNRDAVLRVSENTYLAGGGYFTTPGAWGDIRAMIFASTLDVSLGQGPLQVMTPTRCFSCQAPTDRMTWATITNPILTESLISNGSESHYGTVNANGDILFRAVDGIRSLILGRRDFATWGNVPISSEMDRVLSLDAQELLRYSSAIVFDNRMIMTCGPFPQVGHGVFHTGLIALNFDPVSNLRGKAPSIYDGLWTGINTLQLVVGRFSATERAFAFTYNLGLKQIELYEILTTSKDVFSTVEWPDSADVYDNSNRPIVWTGESPVMFKAAQGQGQNFHRLLEGEVIVDNLVGTVDFSVLFKPDQYPCWTEWFSWSECALNDSGLSKPQFRPRMGLGEPPSKPCDPSTSRPMREGFTFQIKIIVRGHCRVLGARFKAVTMPQPVFAKQSCKPSCMEVLIT